MTEYRKREILDRLYGGDGEVYAPVPERSLAPPVGTLIITEGELGELRKARLVISRSFDTGRVFGSAEGRAAWRKMQP